MARSNPTLKDKSIAEKQSFILDSAWQLFERFGYKKVSVDDIAQKLKISKGAIYLYFSSKEELFIKVLERNLKAPLDRARLIAQSKDMHIENKLSSVIMAKVGSQYASLYKSEVAAEIIEDAFHIANESMQQDMREFHQLVTKIIRESTNSGEISLSATGLTDKNLAYILISSAHGLARYGEHLVSPAVFEKRLKSLISIMISGLK
jgi:AcrR family transcriptional regulator